MLADTECEYHSRPNPEYPISSHLYKLFGHQVDVPCVSNSSEKLQSPSDLFNTNPRLASDLNMTVPMFSKRFQQIAHHILYKQPTELQVRPSIILVPGGWEGPEAFTYLVARLERAGYSVFVPRLPSNCTVPALPNFDEDVKAVYFAVQSTIDAGKDVVLVMHSYGAVVGCEALKNVEAKKSMGSDAEGSTKGVVHLAFICGWLLPEGRSTLAKESANKPVQGLVLKVFGTSTKDCHHVLLTSMY